MSALFPAVILAGGFATRLRPITEKIPKALIDINGEPFISHQLRLLQQQGIRDVILCVGYLGEMLEDFLTMNNHFALNIQFVFDGETLLGTAGAIKKALPLLKDNFFVFYGDSYLPCNYAVIQQTFLQHNKSGLMTVYYNQDQWDTSNVEYKRDTQTIIQYDKNNRTPSMQYIDYGLGIFNKNAFDLIPSVYDLASLYQDLLKHNQLSAYEVKERFYEIGSFHGIDDLRNYIAQQDNRSLSCNL